MELSDRFRFLGWHQRVSGRIPALSEGHRAIARAVISLIFALGLGYLAWQWSGAEALQDWRRSHPPSEALWHSVLEASGLMEIQDSRQLARLTRALPSMTEEDGVWIAPGDVAAPETLGWVARIGDPIRIYSLNPTENRSGSFPSTDQWRPLRGGWTALEALLRITRGEKLKGAQKPKKSVLRDPRELVF